MELVHCPSCDTFGPSQGSVCQQCGKPIPVAPPEAPLARPEQPIEAKPTLPPFEASPEVLARVEHLRQRIAENPDARALYLQLSQIYVDAARKDLANAVLEQLLAVDPENAYVRHRLDQLKRPGAAEASVGRAVGSRPRPRAPRPSGPLASLGELVSRRPKVVALAAGAAVLALTSLWLLFPSTRLIASGEFRAFAAEWSPTGRHIAFLIEQTESVQLAVYGLREGSYRIIGDIFRSDASAFAWSQDGGRIAYEGPAEEGEWEGTIWVADAATDETRRVGGGSSPAWYGDGTSLIVACTSDSLSSETSLADWTQPTHNLCRLDIVTGQSQQILSVDSWEVSFSSAGNTAAFTKVDFDEQTLGSDIVGSNQDFEQFVERVVSDDPGNLLEGSRDLSRELEARRFMESKRGDTAEPVPYTTDVFVKDLLDTGARRITNDGRSSFVSWTPDGRRILYATAGPSGAEVRTMNPDGSDPQVIIPASIEVTDPHSVTLTADGRYALFVAPVEADPGIARIMTGESPADIHVLSVGSTSAKRLENKHPFKQRYALSPDGKRLAYEVMTGVKFLKRGAHSELWLMTR